MEIDIEKIKQQKSIKELLEFGILNIDKPSGGIISDGEKAFGEREKFIY